MESGALGGSGGGAAGNTVPTEVVQGGLPRPPEQNEIAGNAGTDEHDTKFGCESGAGGCRLACGGATRPGGSVIWADEEISGSEGSSSAAGGCSCTSRSKLVQQGAKECKEVERLLRTVREVKRLSSGAQAALGEGKIAELQARILKLQAGTRQDG